MTMQSHMGIQFVSRPILVAGATGLWTHRYTGLPAQLIEAGVLRPEQVLGDGTTSAAFTAGGAPVPRGAVRAWAEPGHTLIRRAGRNRLVLTHTVREEAALYHRKADELADRAWPFPLVIGRTCVGAPNV